MVGSLTLSESIAGLSLLLAAAVLLVAAFQDVKKFKIANWLSIALVLVFPVYAFAAKEAFLPHLLVGLLVLAAGFGFYALRLLGGGDVKLLAAASLWAGPSFVLPLLFATTFLGGGLAFLFAMMALAKSKKNKGSEKDSVVPWHKAPVPYGLAIACGGWFVLFKLAQHLFT